MRYEIVQKIFLAVVFAIGLTACSDGGSSGQAAWYESNTIYTYSGDHGNLWDRMRGNLHLPTHANKPQVREQIRFYQNHQVYLNHIIAESAPYIYYIYQQTQKRHLPAELALIPVIESDYNPYAKSRVGALGLWQMMPDTAKGFGLKRDWWYDGRKDVVASTNAALEYFTYLHSFFNNDWLLAIGAYDCGEGTVLACQRYNQYHHRSGDFWNLPLPNETRDYVPRLLAVAAIVKHPGYYGIHLAPVNDAPYIEQVNVGSPMALSKAANMANVPLNTMKVLNPGIQHGTTDPRGPYVLVVPEDKANTFKEKLGIITQNEKLVWQKHIVKAKESLQKIALKYHTTVAMLKQVNGLNSDKVHTNQTLLIPPTPASDTISNTSSSVATNDNSATKAAKVSGQTITVAANTDVSDNKADNSTTDTANSSADTQPQPATYIVKSGDNLWKIAEKFKVSEKELRHWNKLSLKHRLHAGEKLVVSSSAAFAADKKVTNTASTITTNSSSATTSSTAATTNGAVSKQASNSSNKKDVYIVRRGDYIEKIAKHLNVSMNELKKWNQISSDTILQPGQKLIVSPNA